MAPVSAARDLGGLEKSVKSSMEFPNKSLVEKGVEIVKKFTGYVAMLLRLVWMKGLLLILLQI